MACHTSCMGCRRFSQVVLLLSVGIAGWVPVNAIGQGSSVPEVVPSSSAAQGLPAAEAALINQRSQETLEVAREVSPHTNESSLAYFEDQINKLWGLARIGIAFNCTSVYAYNQDDRIQYYHPVSVFSHCMTKCDRVALLHDYDISEFTIYMHR